jgi:hypothetical protein
MEPSTITSKELSAAYFFDQQPNYGKMILLFSYMFIDISILIFSSSSS